MLFLSGYCIVTPKQINMDIPCIFQTSPAQSEAVLLFGRVSGEQLKQIWLFGQYGFMPPWLGFCLIPSDRIRINPYHLISTLGWDRMFFVICSWLMYIRYCIPFVPMLSNEDLALLQQRWLRTCQSWYYFTVFKVHSFWNYPIQKTWACPFLLKKYGSDLTPLLPSIQIEMVRRLTLHPNQCFDSVNSIKLYPEVSIHIALLHQCMLTFHSGLVFNRADKSCLVDLCFVGMCIAWSNYRSWSWLI